VIELDIEEVVRKAVISHCDGKEYSQRLTDLMIRIVSKFRESDVEPGDLGNFLHQVHERLSAEDS
jgi:hypothetical protein